VYGIAVRMLADSTSAEDLTQSVFMKLWSSPDSFHGGNFAAWISRVTRNRAIDSIRSRAGRAEGEMPVDVPLDVPLEGALDEVVSAQIDAERVRGSSAASRGPASADRARFFRRRHSRRDRASHGDSARNDQDANTHRLA